MRASTVLPLLALLALLTAIGLFATGESHLMLPAVLVVIGVLLLGVSIAVFSLGGWLLEQFWSRVRPVGFKAAPSQYMFVLPFTIAAIGAYLYFVVFPFPPWETYSASPDRRHLVRVEDITTSRWDMREFWWLRITVFRVTGRTVAAEEYHREAVHAEEICAGHSGFDQQYVTTPGPEDVTFEWQDNTTVRVAIDDETMRDWVIRIDGDRVTVEVADGGEPASVSPPTAPASPPAAEPPPEPSSPPRPPA